MTLPKHYQCKSTACETKFAIVQYPIGSEGASEPKCPLCNHSECERISSVDFETLLSLPQKATS